MSRIPYIESMLAQELSLTDEDAAIMGSNGNASRDIMAVAARQDMARDVAVWSHTKTDHQPDAWTMRDIVILRVDWCSMPCPPNGTII